MLLFLNKDLIINTDHVARFRYDGPYDGDGFLDLMWSNGRFDKFLITYEAWSKIREAMKGGSNWER